MFLVPKPKPVEPTAKGIARFARQSFREVGWVMEEPIANSIISKYSGRVPAENMPEFKNEVRGRVRGFAQESAQAITKRKYSQNRHISDAVETGLFADVFAISPAAYLFSLRSVAITLLADAVFLGVMILRGATDGGKKFRKELEGMANGLIEKAEQLAGRKMCA